MSQSLVNPFFFGGAGTGGIGMFEELGRTTLTGNASSISVTNFTVMPYVWVLAYLDTTNPSDPAMGRFRQGSGGTIDTGGNYAFRTHSNNGSQSTAINYTNGYSAGGNNGSQFISLHCMNNTTGNDKNTIYHSISEDSNSGAPNRRTGVGKWADSNQFDSVELHELETSTFRSGTEIVVLGYDPAAATPTNSIWEELADVELTSDGTSIDSGTFTTKKYILIEYQIIGATGASSFDAGLQIGDGTVDTGSDYYWRESTNDAGDSTSSGTTRLMTGSSYIGSDESFFGYYLFYNKASKYKLGMGEIIGTGTAGASNLPSNRTTVGKWQNTSDQFDRVELFRYGGTGNFKAGSRLTIRGFD